MQNLDLSEKIGKIVIKKAKKDNIYHFTSCVKDHRITEIGKSKLSLIGPWAS